eukprot:4956169-Amphidinium_carterae.1
MSYFKKSTSMEWAESSKKQKSKRLQISSSSKCSLTSTSRVCQQEKCQESLTQNSPRRTQAQMVQQTSKK